MKWFACLIMGLSATLCKASTSVDEAFAMPGLWPSALIQGNDGFLHGVTAIGGSFGLGSIYQLTLNGMVTNTYEFKNDGTDGWEPDGVLAESVGGDFYGITTHGPNYDDSALFRLTSKGIFSHMVQFKGGPYGGSFSGGLALSNNKDTLFGAPMTGGMGFGVITSSSLSGILTVLHTFNGADGSRPGFPPIQSPADSRLYGTTDYGGPYGDPIGNGVAYVMDADGGNYQVLYSFSAASDPGSNPSGLLYWNGNLYGCTTGGGRNGGVFKMTPTGEVTTLKRFNDGFAPRFDLTDGKDGYLYGSASWIPDGQNPVSVAFQIDAAGHFKPLHTFVNGYPSGSLLLASDGNFYGPLLDGRIFQAKPIPSDATVPSYLANISTRLRVETGQNVGIGGLIVTGTSSKEVMIRAIGPSLSEQGVSGSLQDPTLELHNSSGALIVSNNDWMTGGQTSEIEASGLAPSDPRESAIIATLSPGGYTAVMHGTNGTSGVGLVEVYDLDTTVDSKMANISTRGFVQTGDNVMIGGWIIGGTDPAEVVVRALGPSLSSAGISNPLADPTLEIHSADGTLIVSNDDWQDGLQAGGLQRLGLAPTDPKEAAIIIPLNPGNYTALVRSANNSTGVGLVEVYQVQP